ncbi:MAG: polymer-forming cytoskeletal protein [Marinilabiliaceae bacterium]|nr:polymer-forming cytoskeletal protein [Marinilabiliaceae bacterium]
MGKQIDTDKKENKIAPGTKIKGDIEANGDIRIDGTVEGNIISKERVIIWTTGVVKGEVKCTNCDIYGSFDGKLVVNELLSLKASSKLTGDIKTSKLSIEPGAIFTGSCDMGGKTAQGAPAPSGDNKK